MGDAARPIEQFKAMQDKQRMLAHPGGTDGFAAGACAAQLSARRDHQRNSGWGFAAGFPDGFAIRIQPTPAAPKTAFEQRKAEVDTSKQAPAMASRASMTWA